MDRRERDKECGYLVARDPESSGMGCNKQGIHGSRISRLGSKMLQLTRLTRSRLPRHKNDSKLNPLGKGSCTVSATVNHLPNPSGLSRISRISYLDRAEITCLLLIACLSIADPWAKKANSKSPSVDADETLD